MKKIIPIILILLLLTGCDAERDIGEITIADETSHMILTQSDEHLLFYGGEQPDMTFVPFNDYYAGFSMPYPEGWSIKSVSANYTTIGNGEFMVIVHHKPLTIEKKWDDNAKAFMDGFEAMLNSEQFTLMEFSDISRRSRQNLTELTIVNQTPTLLSLQYDNIKMTTGLGDYISNKFAEKRYYMRYNMMDTTISILGPIEKKEEAYKIIDYMVGNIRELGVEYEGEKMFTTSEKSIVIPSSFTRQKIELENFTGTSYSPNNVNDAFAGCFIQSYPMPETLDYSFVDLIFRATFPSARSCTYNEGNIFNYDFGKDGIACLCTITEGNDNSITPKGITWNIEMYPTEESVIVIGYPVAKSELIKKLSEYQKSDL